WRSYSGWACSAVGSVPVWLQAVVGRRAAAQSASEEQRGERQPGGGARRRRPFAAVHRPRAGHDVLPSGGFMQSRSARRSEQLPVATSVRRVTTDRYRERSGSGTRESLGPRRPLFRGTPPGFTTYRRSQKPELWYQERLSPPSWFVGRQRLSRIPAEAPLPSQ